MVILHVYIANACLLCLFSFSTVFLDLTLIRLSLISLLATSSVNIEEFKDRLSELSIGFHSSILYFLPIDDERLLACYQPAGKSFKHHSQCYNFEVSFFSSPCCSYEFIVIGRINFKPFGGALLDNNENRNNEVTWTTISRLLLEYKQI